MAEHREPELASLSSFEYGQIVTLLHRHRDTLGLQRILTIEWHLFPALGFESDAPATQAALDSDPAFFAELVGLIYPDSARDDSQGEDRPDEAAMVIARRASAVLRSWRRCPGTRADGHVDAAALDQWVTTARRLLAEAGCSERGGGEIGRALAHAAPDLDGTHPPHAVRDLLERIDSDTIDPVLAAEILVMRGGSSRALDQGGEQERSLAATYRTAASAAPRRTRRILQHVADSYDQEAQRHDQQAEQHRRGLNCL